MRFDPGYDPFHPVILTDAMNRFDMRYICCNCGYIYDPEKGDPENGIDPGTAFESLPDSWVCPICYVAKDQFDPLD